MNTESPEVLSLFCAALDRAAGPEREAFLAEACAGQADLRSRIEALLRAHAQAEKITVLPAELPSPPAHTVDYVPSEQTSSLLGPYKLLEQLGEGGFGVVYLAEQTQPVRRKVAVKLVKPGMDSRQILARFMAERQALAIMDHPNIARVFDGGTTAAGLPYFVMELVKGVPITTYCDQHRLPPQQRLELFLQVCQAVQHAHQKGVIHRDIKPSNVLVTRHDTTPLVKVIDFGVAKALGQKLTDQTLFTGIGQLIGTPLYMSPEQAGLSDLDIDTRSDIYSLGVLLYELLTGSTPFTKEQFRKAALDEMLKMICEQEPPKPSTRLSSSEALPSIAASRGLEPRKLSGLVRGDLDWIVMKALEKDRSRRYETATGFAADIQHFLADEPVLACPPSSWYRLRKFARRHKRALAMASVLLLGLIVGLVVLLVSNQIITRQRNEIRGALDESQQARKREQEQRRLAETRQAEAIRERQRAERNYHTARDAVDRLYTQVAEQLLGQPHTEKIRRQLLEDALQFYLGFLRDRSQDAEIKTATAHAFRRAGDIQGLLGDWKNSLENQRAALRILLTLHGPQPADPTDRIFLAQTYAQIAAMHLEMAQFAAAEQQIDLAVTLLEDLAQSPAPTPRALEELAIALAKKTGVFSLQYKWKEVQATARRRHQVLRQLREAFPQHAINPQASQVSARLQVPHDPAARQQLQSQYQELVQFHERLMMTHPEVPIYRAQLSAVLGWQATLLTAQVAAPDAEPVLRRQLEVDAELARRFPEAYAYQLNLAWTHYKYGAYLYEAGKVPQAREHLRQGIELLAKLRELYPRNQRFDSHLAGMLTGCPDPTLRQPPRAIAVAQKQIDDKIAEGWGHQAAAFLHAGRYQEALAACKLVLAQGPNPKVALVEAWAQWYVGDKQQARVKMQQALAAIDSGNNDFWYTPSYRMIRREITTLMK